MLGEVFPKFLRQWHPSYIELVLDRAIAHPVKAHIYHFTALLFALTPYSSIVCAVVLSV
jgi:hypothetical protein